MHVLVDIQAGSKVMQIFRVTGSFWLRPCKRTTKKKKAVYFIGSLAIWYSYSIIISCPLSNPTALAFSVSVAICSYMSATRE